MFFFSLVRYPQHVIIGFDYLYSFEEASLYKVCYMGLCAVYDLVLCNCYACLCFCCVLFVCVLIIFFRWHAPSKLQVKRC